MAWMKVETGVARNPKLIQAGPAAAWLWLCGLAYCEDGLTDGFIPRGALEFLGVKGARRLVARLEACGLWDPLPGGWHVHDYADHHRSAQQVREIQNLRRDAGQRGGVASGARRAKQSASGLSKQTRSKPEASVEANPKQTSNPARSARSARPEADRQTDARGRARGPRYAFEGRVLAITPPQHEILVRMLNGVDVDLLGEVYPRWNRELEASGEPFDTLVWCTERLKRQLRIGREGHGPRPVSADDQAAMAEYGASQRALRTRDAARQAEREDLAEGVLPLLTDDERAAVEAEAVEALASFRTRMTSDVYQAALERARRNALLEQVSEADLKARVREHLKATKPLRLRPPDDGEAGP